MLVAAGGTGGHLFPAEALAAALDQRGIAVHLATDQRAARYGGAFADEAIHVIASATLRARNPFAAATDRRHARLGVVQALGADRPAQARRGHRLRRLSDDSAGAGRGLARRSEPDPRRQRGDRPRQPACWRRASPRSPPPSPTCFRDEPALAAKATLTGNPVRPAVVAAAATPYPAPSDPLRLLVFGGSQGARDHGRYRARRDRAARCRPARAACHRAAGARGGFGPRARRLRRPRRRRRGRAVLLRSAGAHGGEPSGGLALRGLDRRRTRRDRPARDPGAAAARARPGPVRQCRRARTGRRRHPARAGRLHPAAARRRDCRACGGAAAARGDGGGGAIGRPARCRRPARRSGAARWRRPQAQISR